MQENPTVKCNQQQIQVQCALQYANTFSQVVPRKLSIWRRGGRVSVRRGTSFKHVSVGLVSPKKLTTAQPDTESYMQLDVLLKVGPSPTLLCQRSSDAVNYLMAWLPQAMTGSLIYTWGLKWMIHRLREGYQDMWQLYALLALSCSQIHTSPQIPRSALWCLISLTLRNWPVVLPLLIFLPLSLLLSVSIFLYFFLTPYPVPVLFVDSLTISSSRPIYNANPKYRKMDGPLFLHQLVHPSLLILVCLCECVCVWLFSVVAALSRWNAISITI